MDDIIPTIHISLGMKINTGNFENQDINIGLAGVPIDASPELLAEIKAKAIRTIQDVMEPLAEEMFRIRTENYT